MAAFTCGWWFCTTDSEMKQIAGTGGSSGEETAWERVIFVHWDEKLASDGKNPEHSQLVFSSRLKYRGKQEPHTEDPDHSDCHTQNEHVIRVSRGYLEELKAFYKSDLWAASEVAVPTLCMWTNYKCCYLDQNDLGNPFFPYGKSRLAIHHKGHYDREVWVEY